MSEPLMRVRNIVQQFAAHGAGFTRGARVHAVSDVSFDIRRGETLGMVGESGSGKSTIARSLLQCPMPRSGSVHFRGEDLTRLRGRRLLEQRRYVQMVFQDPFGSLDPTWRVADIVAEPLVGYHVGNREQRLRRVQQVLELVGLPFARYGERTSRELSGGECQRVAIARALALDPVLIICDEAVSALDVLIQAQLLNLFETLRTELGLAYLFISHDLALVRQISDRVAVLHLGQLCEIGPATSVYCDPLHPYTSMLLSAAPGNTRSARYLPASLSGELPSPVHPPSGCRFRTRCPQALPRCAAEVPPLQEIGDDHFVACHFPQRAAR